LGAACSEPADPIAVRDNIIHVENRTSREWRNVVVVVNDHFREARRSSRREDG
jgi:hypothetical protein